MTRAILSFVTGVFLFFAGLLVGLSYGRFARRFVPMNSTTARNIYRALDTKTGQACWTGPAESTNVIDQALNPTGNEDHLPLCRSIK